MRVPDRRSIRHMLDVIGVLVARDQKARYQSTAMGVFWAVVSPALFLMTFYVLFKVMLPLNIPNYASHLFIALILWTWFQTTTMEAVGTIVGNPGLVNQPRFPVAALPLAATVSNFVTLLLTLPLLVVILWVEGANLGPALVALPILTLCQFVFVLSMAYFVSALNVVFRDLQYIVPILLQFGYFTTPIFYSADALPERARQILSLNPMLQIIEAHRSVLIYGEWPDWRAIGILLVASLVLLALTYRFFRGASLRFLEEI
ncbi:ABC transporter permease [Defluviimonas salinarum]|uniref:Transport permease protein n=1 Tax=Defluviimonas salinarum TaxID=2992147 RepID=A0ABT3J1Z4_9RHOB|nr:ABC transporter permease [Defluviimonas salinarum]MCW3781711.1 ABC transporter permease [Defluviimonas salinarum]